ncbi:MAG: ABC transporter permease subunit [Pseudomonadales bacterium]|nr:ABC transporter permease subunit [Pseudomonadales bacterium]
MARFLFRRLAFVVVTLWVVVSAAFFLIRAAPGGPFDGERRLPPAIEKNLLASYHLDEPLPAQYWRYLRMVTRGDLGPSFKQKDFTVNELIAAGLPISLGVGIAAFLFALLVGTSIGTFAALRHNTFRDRFLSGLATLGLAFPPLIVGPVLVLVFAVGLAWFPAGGHTSVKHYVLPTIALALPYIAAFARLSRVGCLEALDLPHVTTARSKGLSRQRLVFHHVLPSALVPVLSYSGPAAAALLAGSMVVEEVFSLPGLGRYFVQGAINRDYTLVMGTVLVYAVLILALNLLVDLLYGQLDPRIRSDMVASSD